MHSSFFNYSVTRPYPYRWFTPVAVTGTIILLVLLSLMNFVQNSYVLNVAYAYDPNSTITSGVWYNDWPSYLTSSVRPTCEPVNVPVNTQFFTNQSGLMWTLTSVVMEEKSSVALPSLTYMNNVLEECDISQIQMAFDGSDDQDVSDLEHVQWNIQVRAFVTCRAWGPAGFTIFNATAMYDAMSPYAIPGSTSFVGRDATTRASMFWAEALLSAYWTQTVTTTWTVAESMSPTIAKGVATLFPSQVQSDITSLDFFEMTFYFLPPGNKDETYFGGFADPPVPVEHYILLGGNDQAKPQIWQSVDSLAKSMYSAALTDLGQTARPTQSNILGDAATLQYFSSNFSSIAFNATVYPPFQLESQSYDARQRGQNPTGPLLLSPAVISTEYLCQIPQRKAIGDVFISVLLADLVLLQAAWKLYTFAVDQIFLRRKPEAMHCEGCACEERHEPDVIPNGGVPNPRLKSGSVVSNVEKGHGRSDKTWPRWHIFRLKI